MWHVPNLVRYVLIHNTPGGGEIALPGKIKSSNILIFIFYFYLTQRRTSWDAVDSFRPIIDQKIRNRLRIIKTLSHIYLQWAYLLPTIYYIATGFS